MAHGWNDPAASFGGAGTDQPAGADRGTAPLPHDRRVHLLRRDDAVFAPVLDDFLGTRKALTSTVSLAGLSTLGVAAVPLSLSGGGTEDVVHGTFATLGYIGMALSPLIGAVAFNRRRRIAAAAISGLTGIVSAAASASTPFVSSNFGLLQRLGLGVVDAWLVVMAISILDGGRPPQGREPPARH